MAPDAAGSVVIAAIAGMAGVGKSALAVHWSYQIRDRFPDGQLYVNLRGFDRAGAAMEPSDAIRGFLDAFAFGGSNFDDEMGPELVRAVDSIDAAVVGEGDNAFPALLEALAAGSDLGLVPGLAWRVDGKVTVTPAAPPRNQLDDLPVPDYEEYFEHAEELRIVPEGNRNVWLPIETARGCWWGAKHHCTFCGLNGTSMSFRSKSPQRVLDELSYQARKYRRCHFEAVDNILDLTYLKQLFPALIESGAGYQFLL